MSVPFKYTIWGELLRVLGKYAGITFLFLLFSTLYIYIQVNEFMDYLFAAIGCVTLVVSMYTSGTKIALDDKKPYTPAKPNALKGLILPIFITAISSVLLIGYHYAWAGGSPSGFLPIAINAVSMLWFSMLRPLAVMQRGFVPLYGYFILLLLPHIATFLGYLSGKNNFYITKFFKPFIYEHR